MVPVSEDGADGNLRAAAVAEVLWVATGASPPVRARGVLPLVGPRGPVLALPYADRGLALELAAADEVVLTLTEPRGSGRAWSPEVLRCHTRLEADPTGDVFVEELLSQELRRWPPSRLLADSPLLRREHWWWLPRLLVHLDVQRRRPFTAREAPGDHVLGVATGTGLELSVVEVSRGSLAAAVAPLPLRVRGDPPAAGEAVLFGQALSLPDRERWGRWSWEGHWDGSSLVATRSPTTTGLPPVPGLRARWRRQRDLARACRDELSRS